MAVGCVVPQGNASPQFPQLRRCVFAQREKRILRFIFPTQEIRHVALHHLLGLLAGFARFLAIFVLVQSGFVADLVVAPIDAFQRGVGVGLVLLVVGVDDRFGE
jgi:hypothetical protein